MKRDETGIGLVEVLIAIGMLGGLVLLISGINQNAHKVAANLEINTDVMQTLQEIQQILVIPENCAMTFQGKNAVSNPNVVQAIKQKFKTTFADVYPNSVLNPQKVYGSKRVKIDSYALSDTAPEVSALTHGTTHLVITFNRGKTGTQTETITKRITLNVKTDGAGNITGCTSTSSSKNEIWKFAANNSDIYFNTGAVAIGTTTPTHNLTIQARTLPGTSGISIIGNEATTAGWNRAGIMFNDQSSNYFWSLAMFGVAAHEGEGGFGIGGGPTTTTGLNRFLITKQGNVGINTNLQKPTCGLADCSTTRFLHIHSNAAGPVDASQLVLTTDSAADGSIAGGVGFSAAKSAGPDRRVGVITGHIVSPAGSTLKGNLLFWTNNNGANNFNGVLNSDADFWVRGNTDTVKFTATSDVRLKKNIRPLQASLEKVLAIKGVSYNWKDSNYPEKNFGFIAQDVEKVFPELIATEKDGKMSMSYIGLVAPVVEALKSLFAIKASQEKQISQLEAENKMMLEFICKKEKASFCY
ncbi:tail fiber domain-containing protein [Peredibacter starrii]|uniref:Tail fiber domain-containing protein n=1 Tax=Peredibacter starrii TaxID=28202 RepID=A0AAX4HQ89_9BACT|nr:tail fiber domain-containing protein [Peredibacter starrii]WPU65485.1 tail fiber domain-containing protein [Peredibacter starrii]